jgi:hypothetical protein
MTKKSAGIRLGVAIVYSCISALLVPVVAAFVGPEKQEKPPTPQERVCSLGVDVWNEMKAAYPGMALTDLGVRGERKELVDGGGEIPCFVVAFRFKLPSGGNYSNYGYIAAMKKPLDPVPTEVKTALKALLDRTLKEAAQQSVREDSWIELPSAWFHNRQ